MKKNLFNLLCLIFFGVISAYGQAPQQFNYQGALRNSDGTAVANKNISIRLSVLSGSENGAVQYSEIRNLTTSSLGLYAVAIGSSGAISTTKSFDTIDWGGGLKYLKVEVDLNGGSNFASAGTTQLLSVPYALYAANAPAGANGKSAYQIWLDAGNSGTPADFLNSLKSTGQSVSGDLSGTVIQPIVVKIQGTPVSSVAPTAGQILRFNGTTWEASAATPAVTGADVATTQPDLITLSNNKGAALTNLGINLKPGDASTYLITDENQKIKWQPAAGIISGKVALISFGTLDNGTTIIPANDVAKVKIVVDGAKVGNSVFISNVSDETEYSILTSWVSAPNEVSVRLANYQPQPVDITGRQYKILIIQN